MSLLLLLQGAAGGGGSGEALEVYVGNSHRDGSGQPAPSGPSPPLQSLTGGAFVPALGIFYGCALHSGGSTDVNCISMFGAADSALNQAGRVGRAQNAGNTRYARFASDAVMLQSFSTLPQTKGAVDSFYSGGADINWLERNAGSDYSFGYVFLGGAAITATKVGTFVALAGVTTEITVTPGIQARFLCVYASRPDSVDGNGSSNSSNVIGVYDVANGVQVTVGMEMGASGQSSTRWSGSKIVRCGFNSGGTVAEATITTVNATQFGITFSTPPNVDTIFGYIALAGTFQMKISETTMPASVSPGPTPYAACPFPPKLAMVLHTGLAAEDALQGSMGLGFYDGTRQGAYGTNALDRGTGDRDADRHWSITHLIRSLVSPTPTHQTIGAATALTGSGHTIDYTSHDGVQRKMFNIWLGDASSSGSAPVSNVAKKSTIHNALAMAI